jgi:hypothetical protein
MNDDNLANPGWVRPPLDWQQPKPGVYVARSGGQMREPCDAPEVAALVEALRIIDALNPERHIDGFSADAVRGLVLRMGEVARAALAAVEGRLSITQVSPDD